MADSILTRLYDCLAGEASATHTTTTKRTKRRKLISYFEEGPGSVCLEYIGRGGEGWVCLVRSLEDHDLYVRKQTFDAFPSTEGPPPEAKIANLLQNIAGTIKLHGWFRYQTDYVVETDAHRLDIDEIETEGFYVTYWTYCNSGDLSDCLKSYQEANCIFPEKWAGQWLASMLKTLIELHRNKIAHNDTHAGNWFIHRQSPTADPEVFLGDFGACEQISDDSSPFEMQCWADIARADFERVAYEMRRLVGTHGRLRDLLNDVFYILSSHKRDLDVLEAQMDIDGVEIDFRTPITEFNDKVESVVEKIEAYARSLPEPHTKQDLIKETKIDVEDDLPTPLADDKFVKVWKDAILEGKEVTVPGGQSTVEQNMSHICKEGEWLARARTR